MANVCGADDTLMKEHIAAIADLQSHTSSNTKRLDKNDCDIAEIQKTHSILLSMQTQMQSLEGKVETQMRQSEQNTKEIINALIANKKTVTDRSLDSGVYLLMIVIFWVIGQFFGSGGTL